MVERVHQELQKVLGMLMKDVCRSYPSEWSELLPVVEFTLYTTPGPHGFSPRDVDRRWSGAIPLEKDLAPYEAAEFETMSEHMRRTFESYREIKAKVTSWRALASAKKAEYANRHRKEREIKPGQRVLYRDPRQQAVGGRSAWREPLTGPSTVESVVGNKLLLKRESDGQKMKPTSKTL